MGGRGLGREVAEKLFPVVDQASRTRQRQKGVVCPGSGPSDLDWAAIATDVKWNAALGVGQKKPVPAEVENDGTARPPVIACSKVTRRVSGVTPALEKQTDAGYRAWHAAGQNVYPERKDFRESSHRFRMDSAKAAKQREGGNRKTTMHFFHRSLLVRDFQVSVQLEIRRASVTLTRMPNGSQGHPHPSRRLWDP